MPHKGYKQTIEHTKKIRVSLAKYCFKEGFDSRRFWRGSEHTSDTKRNLEGENNSQWRGGISPYPKEWTRALRKSIRERDSQCCVLCKNTTEKRALDVHHIDFTRNNNNPDNLVTLCRKCHKEVHQNHNVVSRPATLNKKSA